MPLIEDLGSKGVAKPSVSFGYYPAGPRLPHPGFQQLPASRKRKQTDSATRQRQAERQAEKRIAEFERENYHEAKIEIPKLDLVPEAVKQKKNGARVGNTVNSRRILASRKGLSNHMDDDPTNAKLFAEGVSAPSTYPTPVLCSICGYWGKVTCLSCGAKVCDMNCKQTHQETRCFYS